MRLAVATVFALLAFAAPAAADPFLPPSGQLFAGVTGGSDVNGFAQQTGRHPAVFQFFSSWNQPTEYMFRNAQAARARLMIHISTTTNGREEITPKGVATGAGDAYLLRLNERMAQAGQPVYIRLMSEMDGHWNAYSAYLANGRPRGPEHTTAWYRRAWQRTTLILRGGAVDAIDARLRALGLPPVATGDAELPQPQVSMLWVPQVAGAPDTRANAPRAYWPGAQYVDWVGTDFYSKFPNFAGLERFYREFPGKPFAFGEWALWGRDDPAFVHRFFAWVRSHPRVRMLMYNQGNLDNGPFRLGRFPRGRAALASELGRSHVADFAPEYRR